MFTPVTGYFVAKAVVAWIRAGNENSAKERDKSRRYDIGTRR
ncbi:hypothetical protein [Pantoea sp.]|nr:hypothetical protein [Pantoea sp.]